MKKTIFHFCLAGLLLFCMSVPGFAAAPPAKLVVKEGDIHRVIADFIKNRTNGLNVEISIKKIGFSGDISLPQGKVEYEVVAPRQWEGWGNGNLALIIRVDDRVERNIPVRVEVEALADVLVTVRPVDRGEILTAADVAVQKRDVAGITGRICQTPDEVVGKRVRSSLRANIPLRSDAVEKVPLVKSGQMVTILLENQALRITATGQIKNAGAEGDMVMVRNLTSQKYVPARVVDANTVKVEF